MRGARASGWGASVVLALGIGVSPAIAQSMAGAGDVSHPVILQWFESSWRTIERRTADVHAAGYGALWTPPPGRALNTPAGGGIGYDVYDRFDLGRPRDPTLYGTEAGYRRLIREFQRTGGSVYVDFVHHHLGSFDVFPGNSPGPFVQDRRDYPGFLLSSVGTENGDTYRDPPLAAPGTPEFEYQYRLARLITLNFTASNPRSVVRNPVPGMAGNVEAAPGAWAIPTATVTASGEVVSSTVPRQANLPSEANRRFYPDRDGPSRTVVDGGVSYTVYDFNRASPMSGDPVPETVAGYMMRYAQWLVQDLGLDGLRVDAARHVPLGAFHPTFNPTSLDVPRLIDRAVAGAGVRVNLDGTRRSVFQFQEVFNGDPNFLQGFVRRSAPPGDTTEPNRDVLDFPMWFAMRQNLSANQNQNNWYDLRNASQDARDDGLAHNGSQSIGFVVNHDEGGVHLSNVAHAWVLLRPGQAYVYFRGNDFSRPGNTSFFLKDGRGDALGGQYGTILTTLVDIRNGYGRGNFRERFIDGGGISGFSNVYAFERQGSFVAGLSSFTQGQAVTSFDQRTMYVDFAPGTRLVELTGNAADVQVDPLGQIPEVVVVGSTDNPALGAGRVTLRIPRNENVQGLNHGRGYVVYGLPRPAGTVSLSNVSQVIPGEVPTPATNSTTRLSPIDVIASDQFTVTLSTQVVTLSDGFVDHRAAGSMAMLKLNDGFDVNGNGTADFPSSLPSNATRYGFEQFLTTNVPGFVSASSSRPGVYQQVVDATRLTEGYHYLTVRAWRAAGPGESEVFTDFRRTIYVDRLPPVSAVQGFAAVGGHGATRDLLVRSVELTAESVHVLMNLPESVTEPEILSRLGLGTLAEQIDRDLFSWLSFGTVSGNHVATVVTLEITGNYSVQRFAGLSVVGGVGLGLGDVNADGVLSVADVLAFEELLVSAGTAFHPAADIAPDGRIDLNDLRGLGFVLREAGADGATLAAYQQLVQGYLYIPEPGSVAAVAGVGLILGRRWRQGGEGQAG